MLGYEYGAAAVSFVLLGASAALGFALRQRLADHHLSDHNLAALRLVTGLLVTFAALVLSLLLASVKASFDTTEKDRILYAESLTQLDQSLRNYGEDTTSMRAGLRSYTAAVIASTWPEEPRPVGVTFPDPAEMARTGDDSSLARLMNEIDLGIAGLAPKDAFHLALAASCRASFTLAQHRRWAVIEDAQGVSSGPFSRVLMFWLMLVFISFGLQAPRNAFTVVAVGMGALSISTVIFVIADLQMPYGGLFGIPSTAMRHALSAMLR